MYTSLLTLAVAVTIAAPVPKEKGKLEGDVLLMQGSWDWDPATKQSEAKPQILTERVVIKNNTLVFHYSLNGQAFSSETEFQLDPKADPKTIDFASTEDGPNKGKWYLGRYEVADGKLRICYRGPESTRPKDFNDKSDRKGFVTQFITLVPSAKKDK